MYLAITGSPFEGVLTIMWDWHYVCPPVIGQIRH